MKFHNTAKWYMHKPESVLENEIHKIEWKDRPILVSPSSGQKIRPSLNK